MADRIAIIKTGWSDDYKGGAVVGAHGYIEKNKEGHERFNFLAAPDGHFYGYLPPIGENWATPNPVNKDGWLLVFVAKRPGRSGLFITGWYEDARFESGYIPRPEYAAGVPFEHDRKGARYSYAVVGPTGVLVPEPLRIEKLSTTRIKRTPITYLLGNGPRDRWRLELARQVRQQIAKLEKEIRRQGWVAQKKGRKFVPPSKEHRDLVEEAAMLAVEKHLDEKGYKVDRIHRENLGYDLLATNREDHSQLHVEVKGTSGATRQFLMSRKERTYMAEPQWRLGMVTTALAGPKVEMMDKKQVEKTFDFEVFTWQAREKR